MFRILTLFISLLPFSLAFGQQNYDEVMGPNGVRTHYQHYWNIYSKTSAERRQKFVKNSIQDFRGDNALLPLPRVIHSGDALFLRTGVEQRAKAIQAFLKDYYSGKKDYLKYGVIPEEIVQGCINRSKEFALQAMGPNPEFNFWYGPDIIRDSEGVFRVVEDNTGFIGGMGDLLKARQSLSKNMPAYREPMKNTIKPDGFYESIAKRYTQLAQEKGGIPLLITYRQSRSADNEDDRVRQIFKKYGVESHQTNGYNDGKASRLEIRPDGLYFLRKVAADGTYTSRKVGHVILDYEASDFDIHDENIQGRFLNERAKEITSDPSLSAAIRSKVAKLSEDNPEEFKKWLNLHGHKYLEQDPAAPTGYEGFWKLAREHKLGVTNGWGVEFVNDKSFYPYLEKMIHHYLNEEPILKNIDTTPAAVFHGEVPSLNHDAFMKVLKNPDRYVIKGVNGRGGDQVWIGKKISHAELLGVMEKVKGDPQYYIFQKYTPLSIMDGHIVDLRVLTDLSEKGVIASMVPWGRAVPIDANGKVNLSEQGRETTFLVTGNGRCPITAQVFN